MVKEETPTGPSEYHFRAHLSHPDEMCWQKGGLFFMPEKGNLAEAGRILVKIHQRRKRRRGRKTKAPALKGASTASGVERQALDECLSK